MQRGSRALYPLPQPCCVNPQHACRPAPALTDRAGPRNDTSASGCGVHCGCRPAASGGAGATARAATAHSRSARACRAGMGDCRGLQTPVCKGGLRGNLLGSGSSARSQAGATTAQLHRSLRVTCERPAGQRTAAGRHRHRRHPPHFVAAIAHGGRCLAEYAARYRQGDSMDRCSRMGAWARVHRAEAAAKAAAAATGGD